jgi:capsule polysaccharide modification protein KpsS
VPYLYKEILMKIEIELDDADADTVIKKAEMRVLAFKAGLDRPQALDRIIFKVEDAVHKERK